MAPVYDFRHVELDKIGRGKRIVKPPGGECSDIFGSTPSKQYSEPMTPRKSKNYLQSTIFSPDSPDAAPQNGHTTPTTPSKQLDTQDRLFGDLPDELTPRKVVDRQRSSIFEDEVDSSRPSSRSTPRRPSLNPITGEPVHENGYNGYSNGSSPTGSIKGVSPKGHNGILHKISRNPITGETVHMNGSFNGSINGSSNGSTPNGHSPISNGHSSPDSPMYGRCRVPPGGKSSGIF